MNTYLIKRTLWKPIYSDYFMRKFDAKSAMLFAERLADHKQTMWEEDLGLQSWGEDFDI